MVLLSITPLLDGVLQLDIIAPFHTSGPLLLLFHLAIEQWGYSNTGKTGHITISLPISATQILMGLASYVDAIGAGDIGVYDISPTSIIIDVDSGKLGKTDFYWFVLGTV